METIWKYPLRLTDRQEILIPDGARILSVQVQHNEICLWAYVDTEHEKVERNIYIYGTGNPAGGAFYLAYIGTVIQGDYVWHVFI